MKSPGMMLREAREERELSLADVAAMTRIPKTMLGHLEADRFEEYVAEVFVRGHLRNYARELRIDAETVLQAYERHTGRRRIDPLAEAKRLSAHTPSKLSRMSAAPAVATAGNSLSNSPKASRRPARSSSGSSLSASFRPSHIVAVVLVLLGIIVMFSFLSSNRATAQDPTTFPEADASAWEVEQDIQETRWLLEQSDRSD